MLTGKYITNHLDQFDLIMTSSNQVYSFIYENENYILKKNYITMENLSPFWYAMYQVFGNSFAVQRKKIRKLTGFLGKNPNIEVAELVRVSDKYRYLIFKEVEGARYEPDTFPKSIEVEYQLGQYVGYLHSIEFYKYGMYPSPNRQGGNIKQDIVNCMQYLIKTYWSENEIVQSYFEDIRQIQLTSSSFSLIMPDISANQFVYSQNLQRIQAVVDFDAYVVGPREWELSIIELCLNDGDAFRRGYEQYTKIPDMKQARCFYRFLSYLSNPWEKDDLHNFLTMNSFF